MVITAPCLILAWHGCCGACRITGPGGDDTWRQRGGHPQSLPLQPQRQRGLLKQPRSLLQVTAADG